MTEKSIEAEYNKYKDDTPVIMERQNTEDSPCKFCPNEHGDKSMCVEECLRLKEFQFNRSYKHIEFYCSAKHTESLKDAQIANAVAETVKTAKPVTQETSWKRAMPKKIKLVQKVKDTIPAPKQCIFPGCNNPAGRRKNTICLPCYQAWRRGKKNHPVLGSWKTLTTQEIAQDRAKRFEKCLIPGCDDVGNKRELCQSHYKQWHKGLILHPKFGIFKRKDGRAMVKKEVKMEEQAIYETAKPEKKERAGDGTKKELIPQNVLLDFTGYPELYRIIKEISKLQHLPMNHVILNQVATGIMYGEDKAAEERAKGKLKDAIHK